MRGLEDRICEDRSAFIREAESWTLDVCSGIFGLADDSARAAALSSQKTTLQNFNLSVASSILQPLAPLAVSHGPSCLGALLLPLSYGFDCSSFSDSVTHFVRYRSLTETLTGLSRSEKSGFKASKALWSYLADILLCASA
jgi:hypothetical protein